jgi:hypothetical protein
VSSSPPWPCSSMLMPEAIERASRSLLPLDGVIVNGHTGSFPPAQLGSPRPKPLERRGISLFQLVFYRAVVKTGKGCGRRHRTRQSQTSKIRAHAWLANRSPAFRHMLMQAAATLRLRREPLHSQIVASSNGEQWSIHPPQLCACAQARRMRDSRLSAISIARNHTRGNLLVRKHQQLALFGRNLRQGMGTRLSSVLSAFCLASSDGASKPPDR